jgi:hypothetical protein
MKLIPRLNSHNLKVGDIAMPMTRNEVLQKQLSTPSDRFLNPSVTYATIHKGLTLFFACRPRDSICEVLITSEVYLNMDIDPSNKLMANAPVANIKVIRELTDKCSLFYPREGKLLLSIMKTGEEVPFLTQQEAEAWLQN